MSRDRRAIGSEMSSKQLARTVLDGKQVTVWDGTSEAPVTGYLCGMDAYHWLIITPDDGEIHLIHKSAPRIKIHREKTYSVEPSHARLEKVVGPFRTSLTETGLIPARVPATPEGLSA